jgi:hypothetical protein
MTAKERSLVAINEATHPICDDCLTTLADHRNRVVANQVCTHLAREGRIGRERRACGFCRRFKLCSWPEAANSPAAAAHEPASVRRAAAPESCAWHWEGNVQSLLVSWLAAEGYSIRCVADTASHASGKDIKAVSPDGRELWISVKGYPHGTASTNASTQARHWFASAVFDLALYADERQDVHLALGLPDSFRTYASLAARTTRLRQAMGFEITWVSETGQVRLEMTASDRCEPVVRS